MADFSSEHPVEFQLGADFSIPGLGIECIGLLESKKGASKLQGINRNPVDLRKDILDYYKIPLPKELDAFNLEVKTLFISLDSKTNFQFICDLVFQHGALGGVLGDIIHTDQLQIHFEITIKNAKITDILINLHGEISPHKSKVELPPDISFERFDLCFDYKQNTDKEKGNSSQWMLGGSIATNFFDRLDTKLALSYKQYDDQQLFQLTANFIINQEPVNKHFFTKISDIDEILSAKLWQNLQSEGFLDQQGRLTEKFRPWDDKYPTPQLAVLDQLETIDGSNKKHIKKEILSSLGVSKPLINVFDLLSVDVKEIKLELATNKTGGSIWDFSAAGDLRIYAFNNPDSTLINIANGLLIFVAKKEQDKQELKLEFSAKEARFAPPGIPYQQAVGDKLEKRNFGIAIDFESIVLDKKDQGWFFDSSASLSLVDVPKPLDSLFKDTRDVELGEGKFRIEKNEQDKWKLAISVKSPFASIPIPDILQAIKDEIDGEVAQSLPDLGVGQIGLYEAGLCFDENLTLDLTIGIGLPEHLNRLIGMDSRPILKTFDPKNKDSSIIHAKLKIGTDGVSGSLEDSPFQPIPGIYDGSEKDARIKPDKGWIALDLDEITGEPDIGLIFMQKPELALDLQSGSFKASGGYKIDKKRKVKIPLFPVRKALEMIKLDHMAKLMPSGIPVQSIDLFDHIKNEIIVDDLEDALKWMGIDVPKVMWQIILEIAKVGNRFPDRFKDYLSIKIPQALSFAFEVTADSSVSFDLDINRDGDPLQLLIPMLPNPQFMGLKLYHLSFGTAFANSLLKFEVDGEMDTFDLPTLAGAVLLPDIQDDKVTVYLPETAKLQNSFIARELVILIVYETGVPIPIPLFYKRLEIAYFGIDGFEMRDVIAFPKPVLNIMKLLERINDLKHFFTTPYDKEAEDNGLLTLEHYGEHLREEPPESDMDIAFSFGPMYLRLPKIFGYLDTDYYEIGANNYLPSDEKRPDDEPIERRFAQILSNEECKKLEFLLRKRYLTEAGFQSAMKEFIADEQKLSQLIPLCHYNRPMGQVIGMVSSLTISGWDLIYLILDSVKIPSINYPIKYFHIDNRVGNFQLSLFNVFDIYVTWALTTPDEFNKQISPDLCVDTSDKPCPVNAYDTIVKEYNRLAREKHWPIPVKQSPSDELLRLIVENDTDVVIAEDTEGAVIFMRGGMLITNKVIFESAFGLMIESARGFRTGVSFYGYVADILDVKLLGYIKISPKSQTETFKLLGKSSLKVFDREVLSGLFELTNEQLLINGMLDVFPKEFPMALRGHINAEISKQRFLLDAAILFQVGMLKALARIYLHAEDYPSEKDKQALEKHLIEFNKSRKLIKDEFHQDIEKNIDVLFIRLTLINSEFNLSIVAKTDHANQAAINVKLYITALRLLEVHGFLNITVNQQSGFTMQGQAALTIVGPEGDPIIAGQASLLANLDPVNGFLGVQSNINVRFCFLSSKFTLTGGFAFYSWFSNDNAGDFLLSIGGYHPLFKRPRHYPAVPRVGLNFQIGRLSIKGTGYFTLTAACIMAGGRLEATWKCGGITAAFVADANFIMAWKPFSYYANLSVTMRLSYTFRVIVTHTLACELGASIELWGPELSGRARIHIWRLSIPINFGGAEKKKHAPRDWKTFRRDFLPAAKTQQKKDEELLNIVVADGVLKDLSKNDKIAIHWVINPAEFRLKTTSVIPVKQAPFVPPEKLQASQSAVGIAPMGLVSEQFGSVQDITIHCNTHDSAQADFDFEPVLENVPKALWGDSLVPVLNTSPLVNGCIMGFEIIPKKAAEPGVTREIPIDNLRADGKQIDNAFAWDTLSVDSRLTLDDSSRRENIMQNLKSTEASRKVLVKDFAPDWHMTLGNVTRNTDTAFMCAPQIWQHEN